MSQYYEERTVNGYSKQNIDNMIKANRKLNLKIQELENKINYSTKDYKRILKDINKLIEELETKEHTIKWIIKRLNTFINKEVSDNKYE